MEHPEQNEKDLSVEIWFYSLLALGDSILQETEKSYSSTENYALRIAWNKWIVINQSRVI